MNSAGLTDVVRLRGLLTTFRNGVDVVRRILPGLLVQAAPSPTISLGRLRRFCERARRTWPERRTRHVDSRSTKPCLVAGIPTLDLLSPDAEHLWVRCCDEWVTETDAAKIVAAIGARQDFVEECAPRVVRGLMKALGNDEHAVEDVAQDVLLAIHQRIESIRGETVMAFIHHRIRNELKSEWSRVETKSKHFEPMPETDPMTRGDVDEARAGSILASIQRVMESGRVGKRKKRLIRLAQQGKAAPEIAATMRIPHEVVESFLRRFQNACLMDGEAQWRELQRVLTTDGIEEQANAPANPTHAPIGLHVLRPRNAAVRSASRLRAAWPAFAGWAQGWPQHRSFTAR